MDIKGWESKPENYAIKNAIGKGRHLENQEIINRLCDLTWTDAVSANLDRHTILWVIAEIGRIGVK